MKKAFLQLLLLVAIFFAVWLGLSQVHFTKDLHLSETSKKTEKKIGDAIIKSMRQSGDVIEDDSVQLVLDSIRHRICMGNPAIPDDIQMHLVYSDKVNAFAMPGNHIVIYTALINSCDSPSELCGVLAHEISHITLNHVMKRITGELGMITLSSVITHGNAHTVGKVIEKLSTSSFERSQESEADTQGVRYLQHAQIDPMGFANFMNKMAARPEDAPSAMEWLNSHPDTKKRAIIIQNMADSSPHNYKPVISDEMWQALKRAAKTANEDEN